MPRDFIVVALLSLSFSFYFFSLFPRWYRRVRPLRAVSTRRRAEVRAWFASIALSSGDDQPCTTTRNDRFCSTNMSSANCGWSLSLKTSFKEREGEKTSSVSETFCLSSLFFSSYIVGKVAAVGEGAVVPANPGQRGVYPVVANGHRQCYKFVNPSFFLFLCFCCCWCDKKQEQKTFAAGLEVNPFFNSPFFSFFFFFLFSFFLLFDSGAKHRGGRKRGNQSTK